VIESDHSLVRFTVDTEVIAPAFETMTSLALILKSWKLSAKGISSSKFGRPLVLLNERNRDRLEISLVITYRFESARATFELMSPPSSVDHNRFPFERDTAVTRPPSSAMYRFELSAAGDTVLNPGDSYCQHFERVTSEEPGDWAITAVVKRNTQIRNPNQNGSDIPVFIDFSWLCLN